MFKNLKNKTIFLASQSPRRKELLEKTGIKFRVEYFSEINENYPVNLAISEVALYLAKQKQMAYEYLWSLPNHIVITADTIVALDNQILGKPANKKESIEMLSLLSGKTHQVISGVSVKDNSKTVDFSEVTDVTFKPLLKKEIDYYVNNYNTFDKAGGYGIQDWIGLMAISCISGSYYNVMGLPVHRLYEALSQF